MPIVRVPVKFESDYLPSPAMNILHFRIATLGDGAGILEDALDKTAAMYEYWSAHWSPGMTMTIGESMIEDPLGAPAYVPDDPRNFTTASNDAPAPVLLALCASWRTSSATRSGRGRTFFGPLDINTIGANGLPKQTVMADLGNALSTWVNQSKSGLNGWAFGVLSTKTGVFRDVTGFTVGSKFAYLSSRRD